MTELAIVRRFEAAGFRAWPAERVIYDGAWAIRLSSHLSARRLNSVNPLDPGDSNGIEARIARAGALFAAAGRPLTFRISPLTGRQLTEHFDRLDWSLLGESIVMRRPLDETLPEGTIAQIPLKDVARFVEAAAEVAGAGHSRAQGLAALIAAIEPKAGLFVLEAGGRPASIAICVHDGELAGLFEVASAAGERGRGHGRRIVCAALEWARRRGARQAWLQVEASNLAARRLHESLGFAELYRYHYRRPPGQPA